MQLGVLEVTFFMPNAKQSIKVNEQIAIFLFVIEISVFECVLYVWSFQVITHAYSELLISVRTHRLVTQTRVKRCTLIIDILSPWACHDDNSIYNNAVLTLNILQVANHFLVMFHDSCHTYIVLCYGDQQWTGVPGGNNMRANVSTM